MDEQKNYECTFTLMGGACGEDEYELEAFFSLTDEEYKDAKDTLDGDRVYLWDLPDEMSSAIWEMAKRSLCEDIVEWNLGDEDEDTLKRLIPGWKHMSDEELVEALLDDDSLLGHFLDIGEASDLIYDISYPEGVTGQ